jgi:hypothetical protein
MWVAMNDTPLHEHTLQQREQVMKIKFVSGPKTGTIEHLQPSIANVLIASGMAVELKYSSYVERLQEEERARQKSLPVQQADVTWGVAQGQITHRFYIFAKCSAPNCSQLIYDAPPTTELDKLTFNHSCGCSQTSERVPAATAEQFRKLWRAPLTVGKDEAAYHFAARPEPSKQLSIEEVIGRELGEFVPEATLGAATVGYQHKTDLPYVYPAGVTGKQSK